MILFKLLHLAKTGRDIKRDPLAAGLDMGQDVVSPILLIPVLILGAVSIVFGVLSIILHWKILLFIFWLSVPFTLLGCGAHMLIMRLYSRIGRRAADTVQTYARHHGVNIPRDSASSGNTRAHIVDVDYSEH